MAVEGLDTLARLDAHCLPSMKLELKRALILRVSCRTVFEVAKRESVGVGTVKSRLSISRGEIGLALEGDSEVTAELCGYWVGRHLVDCLKDAATELRVAE